MGKLKEALAAQSTGGRPMARVSEVLAALEPSDRADVEEMLGDPSIGARAIERVLRRERGLTLSNGTISLYRERTWPERFHG